jgi:hypothetical protein
LQSINFFNEADNELQFAVFSGAFNIAGFRKAETFLPKRVMITKNGTCTTTQ